jgi:hypothetical protein
VAERPIKGGSDASERVTARPADLQRSATTRKEPGKNQRERAGSSPREAGRARGDDPELVAAALTKPGLPGWARAAVKAALEGRPLPPDLPGPEPCEDCPEEATA